MICDCPSQKRDVTLMMMLLCLFIWSGPIMTMASAGCERQASLPQPRPGARTIFAAVQLSLAQPCLERVRTQGKLTVETRKIGSEEKKRPLTLFIMVCTLSIQHTGPPIVASFQAGRCNFRSQLNGSKLSLRIDHGLTLQSTINILKLAKRQTKNLFQVSRPRMSSSENS